jgi:hypothetical protein
MFDHLLRLLKERAAALPATVADHRQNSTLRWSAAQIVYPDSRTRPAVGTPRNDPAAERLPGHLADFTPALVQAIRGHDGSTCGDAGSDTESRALNHGPIEWPTQFSAPYVDMAAHPMFDISAVARAQGIRFFTLAFVTADPHNRPAWGGFAEYTVGNSQWDSKIKVQIEAVRAAGGDAMVSFGGAAGKELAETITDITALTAAYRQVIETYGLTHIDFDIEGAAQRDRASIDRRSRAIAAIQRESVAAGRTLRVWFTLPILPTGLTNDGLRSVKSAIEHGVKIAGVNGMAMEFGECNAPDPAGKMGAYAIQSGNSLFQQLKTIFGTGQSKAQLWKMVGVTPLIGRNGVPGEMFEQSDARELVVWAQRQGIGRLSMWSLNRDRAVSNGKPGQVERNSGRHVQTPFEFSLIFEKLQD